jgi:DDE superfamily endonuclease/Helix-turn-helix of DDE superfamily endonuclease
MAAASISRPSLLSERQVRELTGLSRAQYGRLIAEIGAAWEADRQARLSARERERAFGAGRKHVLPFAGRLLLAVMYLRWNVTMRFLAEVFGTDKDMVHRAVAELTPLLAAHGITAADGTRLGDDNALGAQLRALSKTQRGALVDGSFVPIPRPSKGGWEAQKAQYSPHRHRHVNTFQALTDDLGNLLWVGDACDGATHDLTAIATSAVASTLADSEVTVIADKAYIGIKAKLGLAQAFTPYRRRKKNDTRAEVVRGTEGEFNTELARQRVHVEHAIRRLKTNKILHGYRRRRHTLTDTIRACAALATMPT